jgi:hypothetical protein
MSFIDASYFVAELNVPNSGQPAVLEKITWFIEKYEPIFLQKLMGYPMYKAFVAGINVVAPATPDIRWLNILYGAEYTDWQGYTQKWKGLIVTDNPIYNLAGGLVYKRPQYLTAGVTAGFTAGVNVATFNGGNGSDDWRGWTPIITRVGVMKPGVDYSWDMTTGVLTLLKPGDKFGNSEYFFVQFELRTDDGVPSVNITPNESCIANFVYYWLYRANVTQTSGFGEVITQAENSVNVSPRKKIASAWNEMSEWVKEFVYFMDADSRLATPLYPEWTNINKIDALKYFGFMNPIF